MYVTGILLVSLSFISISWQDFWRCGGVSIDLDKQCRCGSEVLTYRYPYINRRQCCGPDTCTIDDNGDAFCPAGIIFNIRNGRSNLWNCGDVILTQDKSCQCGSSSLDYDQYRKGDYAWCCPSEPCTYQDDGTAVCHNATIVQGTDKGCDSGVCYDRYYQSCKSGNQCVIREDICHGAPQCRDGSDVAGL